MIVRTESSNTYFLILDQVCTVEQWLSAAGVRSKSPAAGIAERVYFCFFRGMTDIVAEYERYYKQEYRDLWAFLYWHYMVEKDTIQEIRQIYRPPQRLLYGNVHAGGDYSTGDYAMDEEGYPAIECILAKVCRER